MTKVVRRKQPQIAMQICKNRKRFEKLKSGSNSPGVLLTKLVGLASSLMFKVCSLFPSDAFCSIFSLSAKLRFSVSEEFLLQSLAFWDSYCPLQIGCDCRESSLVMFRLSSFAFEGLSLGDLSRLLVVSVTLGSLSRSFRFLSEMRQEDANEGDRP